MRGLYSVLVLSALVGSQAFAQTESDPSSNEASKAQAQARADEHEQFQRLVESAGQRAVADSLYRASLAERAKYYGVYIRNRTSSVFNRYESGGHGSGFIWKIDPSTGKGYIITNNHVAGRGFRDAQELHIGFTIPGTNTDRYVPGRLKLFNHTSDAAVVEFDLADVAQAFGLPPGKPLPFLVAEVASDQEEQAFLRSGMEIFTIGNPLDGRDTVTFGRVTELPKDGSARETEEAPVLYMVKTDAAINPGNSGGPVMDIRGKVVGIATRKNTMAEGTGYFIPISRVIWEVERLMEQGDLGEGFLDVHVAPVPRALLQAKGSFKNIPPEEARQIAGLLLINEAPKESGLITGDVIYKIDGEIQPPDSGAFQLMVATTSAKQFEMIVIRNNQLVSVTVPVRHFGRDRYRQNNHYLSIAGYVFQDMTHLQRASMNLSQGGLILTDFVPMTHGGRNANPTIPLGSVITEIEINGVTHPIPGQDPTRPLNLVMLRTLLERVPEGGSFGIYFQVPLIRGRAPNGEFVYLEDGHGVHMLHPKRHYLSIPRQKLVTHKDLPLSQLKANLDFDYDDFEQGSGLLGRLVSACSAGRQVKR